MFQIKVVEEIEKKFVFNLFFLNSEMWKNIVQWGRPQTTTWRMRIACCITNATITGSQYAIFTALPLQQWLHERASLLRYMYIA